VGEKTKGVKRLMLKSRGGGGGGESEKEKSQNGDFLFLVVYELKRDIKNNTAKEYTLEGNVRNEKGKPRAVGEEKKVKTKNETRGGMKNRLSEKS